MVISYVRLRCPVDEATARYGAWVGSRELEPPTLVRDRDKIDLSLSNESWRGLAVYIFPSGDWTVIEELSGGLDQRSESDWLVLAGDGDLIYANCNDAIGYARLVVIENGTLVRHFLQDEEEGSDDVNAGRLPEEAAEKFESWSTVASWVEADWDRLACPDQGQLWIHEMSWPSE
jgi:hypothetical protein